MLIVADDCSAYEAWTEPYACGMSVFGVKELGDVPGQTY